MSDSPGKLSTRFRYLLLILWSAFGVFVAWNFAPGAGGSDSSGYLNSARLIASGRLTDTIRRVEGLRFDDDWPYTPLGLVVSRDTGTLKPTYPVGLPLHLAAFSAVAGWTWGPTLVGVAGAMAATGLCFAFLRRLGVDAALAFAGTVALAASPVFFESYFQPMSDGLATTWVLAVFYLAYRARDGDGWALGCGAAFSVAVMVRPTNLVLGPVVAILVWDWRRLVACALGALPGAAWIAFYNHALYGGALRSGYGSISELFSPEHVGITLRHYAKWLPVMIPAVVVALPGLFILPWRRSPRIHLGLAAWALVVAGLYLFYYHTHEAWWYLRFVEPAFPAIAILAVLALQELVRRASPAAHRRLALVAGVSLAAVSIALGVYWCKRFDLLGLKRSEGEYRRVCEWARDHLPADALVAGMQYTGALYFYAPFPTLRWDGLRPEQFAAVAAHVSATKRPFYAVLFSYEVNDGALSRRMPAQWERVTEIEHTTIWRFVAAE